MKYHFQLLNFSDLPQEWDKIVGRENRMLFTAYFEALENSLPANMKLQYVAYYNENEDLIGGALVQKLSFDKHNTFNIQGDATCRIRNYLIRGLANRIAIVGNNMLTGQNGFYFDLEQINKEEVLALLMESVNEIQNKLPSNKLIVMKDYNQSIIDLFEPTHLKGFMKFEVQPSMILPIRDNWIDFEAYYNSMTKKYRARVRTARKKMQGLEKVELELEDIVKWENKIHQLYMNIANTATFNTFFLAPNHFFELKKNLLSHFHLYGYFDENKKLRGFYTLIENHQELDTYFLGYERQFQRSHQLYLNMLLDMVKEGIDDNFERINFGRTALEIKSTIGAEPEKLYGLMHHRYGIINRFLPRIFQQINPDEKFMARHPFMETSYADSSF